MLGDNRFRNKVAPSNKRFKYAKPYNSIKAIGTDSESSDYYKSINDRGYHDDDDQTTNTVNNNMLPLIGNHTTEHSNYTNDKRLSHNETDHANIRG